MTFVSGTDFREKHGFGYSICIICTEVALPGSPKMHPDVTTG